MCLAVAEKMQVPLELPCTVALGVLAACCQKKTVVRVDADYIEPLNLYTLAIAQSGERKSPVFRILTAPVYDAQDEYSITHRDEIDQSQLGYDLLVMQLNELKRKHARGKEDFSSSIFALDAEIREYNRLVAPKLFMDDISSEKLIDVLHEQGGSGSIASAEGGLLINMRNQAATNAAFDVYLKGWNEDRIDVARIGRAGNRISNPRLTLILSSQPEVALAMIRNEMLREKGLPGRFLYAMCRSNLGHREVGMPDIPSHVKEEYVTIIRSLLRYTLDVESPEYELPLTADGREAYLDYDRSREPLLAQGCRYYHMRDWAAKSKGQMLRIAGIIAVCEGYGEIDAQIIRRASAIADWYAANAEALFSKPDDNSASDAQYLMSVIMKAQNELDRNVTVRDMKRRTKGKRGGFNLHNELQRLQNQGHICVETVQKNGEPSEIIVPVAPVE
jgi:hypothetical protein